MPSGSRLVARTVQPRAGAQERVGQRGAGVQRGARSCPARSSTRFGPQVRRPSVARSGRPGLLPHAQRRGHRLGHQRRVGQRRQLHQPDAVRVARPARRPRPGAPGGSCPCPPGPVSVSSRVRGASSRAPPRASSRSRPTKLVSCSGRLLGSASSVRRGGKSAGQVRVQQLEDALRPLQVLQPVRAQVAQAGPAGQGVPHQRRRGLGEHHLPPVGRGHQPGAAVERAPRSSAPPWTLHLPQVQPHPRPRGRPPQLAPVLPPAGPAARPGRPRRRRWGGRRRRTPRPPPSRTPPPRGPPPPPGAGRGGGARRPGRRPGAPPAGGCSPPGR